MNLRIATLAAFAAVMVGSLAPWAHNPLVEQTGIEGDGIFTIGLAAIGGLIVLISSESRKLLLLASGLAALSTAIAAVDLLDIQTSDQRLFGEEVRLVTVGWGLWLAAVASGIASVSAFLLARDAGEPELRPPSVETMLSDTSNKHPDDDATAAGAEHQGG